VTAHCYDGRADLLVFVAQLLDEYPHFIRKFDSQALSNTIWSVATLASSKEEPGSGCGETVLSEREQQAALTIVRHCWQSVVERKAMGFDTQALSNTAWAAATLGFGMTTSATAASPNNYVDLPSAHPIADAICTAIQPLLSRNSSQGLGNLAWALARLLGDYSNANVVAALGAQASWPDTIRALLLGVGQQLANPRRAVESQAIANTLWALATLKLNDESLHRSIAARLTLDTAHQHEPQELSNFVWALATAEVTVEAIDSFNTSLISGLHYPGLHRKDPVAMSFEFVAQQLMRRPQEFKSQDISNVLWSCSKVGIWHPIMFRFVAEHVARQQRREVSTSFYPKILPTWRGHLRLWD
jgi:hypothetical protein